MRMGVLFPLVCLLWAALAAVVAVLFSALAFFLALALLISLVQVLHGLLRSVFS